MIWQSLVLKISPTLITASNSKFTPSFHASSSASNSEYPLFFVLLLLISVAVVGTVQVLWLAASWLVVVGAVSRTSLRFLEKIVTTRKIGDNTVVTMWGGGLVMIIERD